MIAPTAPLPIDPLLPSVREALEGRNAAILAAEPGAGKTTRVPPSLLSLPSLGGREVWVLQPRRIAAKLAALRVAEEMGEAIGEKVGYQFRFENRSGPRTRLRFLTDGMLLPLALSDPGLSGVGLVVLDEFHERSLALDLGLAYLRHLQRGPRPDLKLLVMSATLDHSSLASYLGDCAVLESPGRVFPVSVEYFPALQQPELSHKVRAALGHLWDKGLRGTVLAFLPGVGEIRKCAQALQGGPWKTAQLYGDLPMEDQQRVLAPSDIPRVILCTNVAETSLTVPGVTAVVDSGLTRQSRVSPWSGIASLVTVPSSQASAAQRAGRAGRLQEGTCLRLYPKFDFDRRAAFDLPEISRSDLAKTLLDLKRLGVKDIGAFPWFQKPPDNAMEAAEELLVRLGALDRRGGLTELGGRMARLPVHPRLAKFLLETGSFSNGDPKVLAEACRLAAFVNGEEFGSQDLLEDLRRWKPDFEGKRLAEQLEGLVGRVPSPLVGEGKGEGEDASKPGVRHPLPNPLPSRERGKDKEGLQAVLAKALLAAFPDRMAKIRDQDTSKDRNRTGKDRELLLSSGGTVLAADDSLTRSHGLFVVVEARETKGGLRASALCPIEEDWLLDLFPDRLKEETACEWDAKAQRLNGIQRLKYDSLVLEEKTLAPGDFGEEGVERLYKEALKAGPAAYCDPEELAGFLERARFAQGASALRAPTDQDVERALRGLCKGRRGFGDLREAGLVQALKSGLTPAERGTLERLAPEALTLPSGRKLAIHYDPGKPPWAASRIQDFFGMKRGPQVGNARIVLHLLSPAAGPVQVTDDLEGFWERHYPQVRKELMRRYPRHKWPEDPRTGK